MTDPVENPDSSSEIDHPGFKGKGVTPKELKLWPSEFTDIFLVDKIAKEILIGSIATLRVWAGCAGMASAGT